MFFKKLNYFLDHCCDKPGCENVVILDGNMKNARQVCSCKKVTELKFEGLIGSIVVGKILNKKLHNTSFTFLEKYFELMQHIFIVLKMLNAQ